MNRLHTLAPALCALLLAAPAGAIELPELSFEATTYELDNGLRVVLAPDDSAPAVAIATRRCARSVSKARGLSMAGLSAPLGSTVGWGEGKCIPHSFASTLPRSAKDALLSSSQPAPLNSDLVISANSRAIV